MSTITKGVYEMAINVAINTIIRLKFKLIRVLVMFCLTVSFLVASVSATELLQEGIVLSGSKDGKVDVPIDLIEFDDVEAARGFGWNALCGSELSYATSGKIGRHALRVRAGDKPQKYMGISLRRDIDLTGAGADNTISFYIKQNFGRSICINLQTVYGHMVRYVDVKKNEWTHVVLDLDPSEWNEGEDSSVTEWSQVSYLQIYSRGFSDVGHEMLIDGFTLSVDGEPKITVLGNITRWDVPYETDSAWFIGNTQAVRAISKTTGRVLGGWNAVTHKRYLISMEDRYYLEERKTLVTGLEIEDKVLAVESVALSLDQSIELVCSNLKLPDLVIEKRYWPDGNKLFHRVCFTTHSSDLQFITYNSQAKLAKSYRDAGYYMGGGDGGWPLVPAPKINKWKKVTNYRNTTKGMVLHQSEIGFSFSHIRMRMDDNFVWPWYTGAIASYCEPKNKLHYTPDGWDMSLGTSKLSDKETTFEQYISVFEGDWQTFQAEEYSALPAVQTAYSEIPPTPDWVADIITDTNGDIDRIRKIVEMTDEGYITVLVDAGASWADYYVEDGLMGGYGGNIKGEELRSYIQRIKDLSPRVKVGIYMWQLSTSADTRIYKKHPEWFRTTTKDGELCSTFPGMMMNYAQLLSIPEAYDELLSQFDIVLSYLDTDFIYLDDPKAMILYDNENLYVAFTCMEPVRSKPLIKGGAAYDDDEVEIFIDVKGEGKDYIQFIVNAANEQMEYNETGASGNLGAVSAIHIDKSAWSVEMTIPFKGIGVKPPKPGDKWKLSLCRYRPQGKGVDTELIVWAPLKQAGFSIRDVENFGTVVFE